MMLRVSQLRGFNRAPQIGRIITAINVSLTQQNSGWQGFTVRQFIQPGALVSAPPLCQFIRLLLQGPASAPTGIGALWAGVAAAGTPVVGAGGNLNALSVVAMTYQRAASFTIPQGAQIMTDMIQFLYDKSTPLYIGAYFVGATTNYLAFDAGFTFGSTFFYKTGGGGDESGQLIVDPATYTQSTAGTNPLCLTPQINFSAG